MNYIILFQMLHRIIKLASLTSVPRAIKDCYTCARAGRLKAWRVTLYALPPRYLLYSAVKIVGTKCWYSQIALVK